MRNRWRSTRTARRPSTDRATPSPTALRGGRLSESRSALARFDRLVRKRVLQDPIVRVKLWEASGRLAYSDKRRLIGQRYHLGADELASLRDGSVESDVSDLSVRRIASTAGSGSCSRSTCP
jgi:hypothetical protein